MGGSEPQSGGEAQGRHCARMAPLRRCEASGEADGARSGRQGGDEALTWRWRWQSSARSSAFIQAVARHCCAHEALLRVRRASGAVRWPHTHALCACARRRGCPQRAGSRLRSCGQRARRHMRRTRGRLSRAHAQAAGLASRRVGPPHMPPRPCRLSAPPLHRRRALARCERAPGRATPRRGSRSRPRAMRHGRGPYGGMLTAALLACALRPIAAQSTTTFVTSLSGLGSVPIGLTPLSWPGVSVVRVRC
jgi:hypothetical protein